jgi:colanic acid biosynthesis glycosyl transferase WcaI
VRVHVYGINYWPETVGIAPFNTGLCEALAERGHRVTAVTGLPYYPQWRIDPAYRGRLRADEERNGVRVRRTWLHVPRKVTTLGRVVHELSFTLLSALRLFGAGRPDLIVTISPPLFLGAVSWFLSRLWRVPYVFYVKDLQPDAAVDLGMVGRSLPLRVAIRVLYRLERFVYGRSALTATLTEGMRRRIVEKGIAEERVAVLPDWVDAASLAPRPGPNPFRERHGLGDRFVVLHAGNMGVKQGLEAVVEMAERFRGEDDVLFLLVGDGAARPALEERAERARLPNLRFLPLQPAEDVPDMLAAADVCLLVQKKVVSDIVMPSKLLSILGAGRPVVATARDGTEVARAVRESGGGFVVPPENLQALAEGVRMLRRDDVLRGEMGRRGRLYAAERWGIEAVQDEIARRFEEIAGVRTPSA